MKAGILIIDDEAAIRELLTRELAARNYDADAAVNRDEALKKIVSRKYQVAICDLNMPHMNGLDIMEEIRKLDPEIEVIMMTGFATVETAVEAMKNGAYDFVQKPFDLNRVLALVEKCVEKSDLRSVVHQLRIAKQRLEETQLQLIQSEKLAGIGQLAAGVAHELSNPLSGVVGFSQLMLDDKTLSPQQKGDVQMIYAQGQRCKTIIQNLLHFCRRRDARQEALDLHPLIHSTVQLVSYDFTTSGIEFHRELAPSLPRVIGDASQLQQVFLNLITNARQALEDSKQGRVVIRSRTQKNKVIIEFEDNGPGIPDTIKSKVFDPFFTTKQVGKGTGLGLSISYGILKSHRGDLRVESQFGKGATFFVELPVAP